MRNGYTKIFNRRELFANLDQDTKFKPLNTELNPVCHLLALLGARNILHASKVRVNLGKIECKSTDWITCLKLRLQVTYIIPCKDKSFGLQKKSPSFPRSEHNNELLKKQGIYWLSEYQTVF